MRYSFQGHFQSKMWSIAKEYLPEAKQEEFWRYIRLADEIRPPREIAAVEVAVGVVSHLPSQLDTLEAMLQADYAAAERVIGAREGDGPGTIWGRGPRCLSSVAAGRLCDSLRMLVRAR